MTGSRWLWACGRIQEVNGMTIKWLRPNEKKKWKKARNWLRTDWKSKELLFLLTGFIRKENLDKRGCKITEIVKRQKIKAEPIFWGSIHIRNELCSFLFCSPQWMTFDPRLNSDQTHACKQSKCQELEKHKDGPNFMPNYFLNSTYGSTTWIVRMVCICINYVSYGETTFLKF